MNKKEWSKLLSSVNVRIKRADVTHQANLDVSRITPVIWNTEAFNSLVIDKETKELISALVTNQIDAEKATDLMSGKGNGLFILLHGYKFHFTTLDLVNADLKSGVQALGKHLLLRGMIPMLATMF
jgi:hypothetical protein